MASEEEDGVALRSGGASDDTHHDREEAEEKGGDDDEHKHFVVIHIGDGEGFKPILGQTMFKEMKEDSEQKHDMEGMKDAFKHLFRPQSDPYCKVTIDDGAHSVQTHVVFNCSKGDTKWAQYRRFYVDPNDLPKIITVEAFDKSEEPGIDDACFGSFVINCAEESIFASTGKVWQKQCEIGSEGVKVNIRVSYGSCSMKALQQRIADLAFMNEEELSEDTKVWIVKNAPLYQELCNQLIRGSSVSTDGFNDIEYPPRKFKMERHFKQFACQYSLTETDKKGIYYDAEFDIVYAVDNNSEDNMFLGGINVTAQVHLLWRYVYLKDILLAGQDSQFNIYKSYIFDSSPQKLSFTFLAVVVQLALTVAISYDIWSQMAWGFEDGVFGAEITIKILSGMVFVLLSIGTNRTTQLYYNFYQKVGLMFRIPWYLLICDFISNIVVSITITLFSYLFLCASESYTDLVLNAFALTFVAEIDDAINTFESDEDEVIAADLRAFMRDDCAVPRKVTYTWREFLGVFGAPLALFKSLFTAGKSVGSVFIQQSHNFVAEKRGKYKDKYGEQYAMYLSKMKKKTKRTGDEDKE